MLISLSCRWLSCRVQGGLANSALVYQDGEASYFTLLLIAGQETIRLNIRRTSRRAGMTSSRKIGTLWGAEARPLSLILREAS
jgi:hypothetical protein